MSGWTILLPLVGAVVGGIVGAWANSWYRDKEAKKARDEECERLLILLSDEVATNNLAFDLFLKERVVQPEFDNRTNVAANLHSAVWDESKARLAQLLIPGIYLATVASYYRRIDLLRLDWTMPSGKLSEDDTERVRSIKGNGIDVIRATQGYISDPRIFAPLLDEDASGPSDNSKEANPT
jgi:gas vesicle protein